MANIIVVALVLMLMVLGTQPRFSAAQAQLAPISASSEPDLAASSSSESGAKVPVSAYRVLTGGPDLEVSPSENVACNTWLSYGYPAIVRQTVKSLKQTKEPLIFHFSQTGFSFDIQLLTEKQRVALAIAASVKYNRSIAAIQIGSLLPSAISCSLELSDNAEKFVLSGQAVDTKVYPYTVLFNVAEARQRNVSEKILRSLNEASCSVDELRNIACDVDFNAAAAADQFWSLSTVMRRRFMLHVRKADFFLYEGTYAETGSDTQTVESDCPAYRKKPWRYAISYDTVPYAASIMDSTVIQFARVDGVTITLYQHMRGVQWDVARLLCDSVGWTLARLMTKNMLSATYTMMMSTLPSHTDVWVGARYEGSWGWCWHNTTVAIGTSVTWCSSYPVAGSTVGYMDANTSCMKSSSAGSHEALYYLCSEK